MDHPPSPMNLGAMRAARLRSQQEPAMARKDQPTAPAGDQGTLSPHDTDPNRFGREPETALRHEALAKAAAEAEARRKGELEENATARARAVDEFEDSQSIEDKSHGGVSVVPPADAGAPTAEVEKAVAGGYDAAAAAGAAGSRPLQTGPSDADRAAEERTRRIDSDRAEAKAGKGKAKTGK